MSYCDLRNMEALTATMLLSGLKQTFKQSPHSQPVMQDGPACPSAVPDHRAAFRGPRAQAMKSTKYTAR